MALNILLCSSDVKWLKKSSDEIESKGFSVEATRSGKDAQLLICDRNYTAVFIDLSIKDYSSFSILKYVKLNRPSVFVFYFFSDENSLQELGLNRLELFSMGVNLALEKSEGLESVFNFFRENDVNKESRGLDDMAHGDHQFEEVKEELVLEGKVTSFDLYVKIGSSKFVKVLYKGDSFDNERISRFKKDGEDIRFYASSSDRLTYIKQMNNSLQKLGHYERLDLSTRMKIFESISNKYINEVYVEGVNSEIIQEGKKICDQIYNSLCEDEKFNILLDEFAEDFQRMEHCFLVAFFSIAIGRKVNWVAQSSIQKIGTGGLLHDIRKLKFPDELHKKKYDEINAEEKKIYEQHCQDGYDILKEFSFIEPAVLQIVLHHHERMDGTGYPRSLSGIKIHPLAKIICLANEFAHYLQEFSYSGVEGVQQFLEDEKRVKGFEVDLLDSLKRNFDFRKTN